MGKWCASNEKVFAKNAVMNNKNIWTKVFLQTSKMADASEVSPNYPRNGDRVKHQKVKEGLYTKLVGELRIIKSCKEQRDIDTFWRVKFGYQPGIFGVLSSYKKLVSNTQRKPGTKLCVVSSVAWKKNGRLKAKELLVSRCFQLHCCHLVTWESRPNSGVACSKLMHKIAGGSQTTTGCCQNWVASERAQNTTASTARRTDETKPNTWRRKKEWRTVTWSVMLYNQNQACPFLPLPASPSPCYTNTLTSKRPNINAETGSEKSLFESVT